MDNIVGLGSAGCNIAALFEKYPQYKVYKIDSSEKQKNTIQIKEVDSPELYEKICPDLTDVFRDISGDTLFIVGGGGYISGASLRILEKIYKRSNIHVLYIVPNSKDLNRIGLLQNKVTYNVFQEYARSGLFNKLMFISNDSVESVIGDVPILSRNLKINEFIVNMVHSINIFSNTDAIIDNSEPARDASRICTFGVYDLSSQEKLLHDISGITDKRYYFAINEKTLSSDPTLLKKIRDHLSTNDCNCSYSIHSTQHESYCFLVADTNIIQQLDN